MGRPLRQRPRDAEADDDADGGRCEYKDADLKGEIEDIADVGGDEAAHDDEHHRDERELDGGLEDGGVAAHGPPARLPPRNSLLGRGRAGRRSGAHHRGGGLGLGLGFR